MKYVLAAIAVIAALAFLAWRQFTGALEESAWAMQQAPVSSSAPEGHITAADLERLGCKVDPALGKYLEQDFPMLGLVRTYALRSETDCRIALVSQMHKVSDQDPGIWAGVRAGVSGAAQRRGLEVTATEGDRGEHSELHLFEERGAPRGFTYAVQDRGLLVSLTVFSSTLLPSAQLEQVVHQNMAKAKR